MTMPISLGLDWKHKLWSWNHESSSSYLSVPEGTCPLLGAGTRSTSGDDPPCGYPGPCPNPLTCCEWTFIVTHQEPTTNSFTYNLLSTIYIVAWMHSHQLDNSSAQHLDHDSDLSFHPDVP